MVAVMLVALTMFVGQGKEAALPDTPQGRQVAAWLKGFNSGDVKAFEKAQQETMAAAVLARRTPEERAKMFERLRGDFGNTMTIEKVKKATAQQIQILVISKDGAQGTFTFDFEEKAPFKITGLGVDVEAGGGV